MKERPQGMTRRCGRVPPLPLATALLLTCLVAATPASAQSDASNKPAQTPQGTGTAEPTAQDELKHPSTPPQKPELPIFGYLEPDFRGFKLAEGEMGSLNVSLYTYLRYLNQNATDDTYTDAFGRTKNIDQRNDIQLQKVKITFKGWVFDPNFGYNAYVWTSNAAQGQPAQVVGAGWLTYRIVDELTIAGGIWSVPGVRTLEGEFPKFYKVDSRTIADEFFRGAYTSGVWAMGNLTDEINYRVMLANNLSTLGVDATQLDNKLDTVSGAIVWKPGGTYGSGYGDFEYHDEAATRFGLHATRSTEDRQSQPGKNDPENTQIRLSDGTAIFDADAFAPGTQVQKALYQMISIDSGIKYHGFAIEGEYYMRWLSDFRGTGPFPVQRVFDHGFQLQTSYMLIPKHLQTYVSGSKIFGQYGNPYDISTGLNWYPFSKPGYDRQFRVSPEVMFVRNCPTGNTSVPYSVGSNGVIFLLSAELSF